MIKILHIRDLIVSCVKQGAKKMEYCIVKGHNSVIYLRKMTDNNQNLDIFDINDYKWGTFICAHAWIFFKLCILIIHYIRTVKMYLSNKIVKNKA